MKELLYICVLLYVLQERGVFCIRLLTFPPPNPTMKPLKYWLIPGWREYGIPPDISDTDIREILDQIVAFKRGLYCPYKNSYECQNPYNSDDVIKKIVQLTIGTKPYKPEGKKMYKPQKMNSYLMQSNPYYASNPYYVSNPYYASNPQYVQNSYAVQPQPSLAIHTHYRPECKAGLLGHISGALIGFNGCKK